MQLKKQNVNYAVVSKASLHSTVESNSVYLRLTIQACL